MNIEQIAKICHQANRAYCEALGDDSQPEWDFAPEWQRMSAINGVNFRIENPSAGPSASHDNWMKEKLADGWKYGPQKQSHNKEHPCLVPYEQLPEDQRVKDVLFLNIVNALKSTSDATL